MYGAEALPRDGPTKAGPDHPEAMTAPLFNLPITSPITGPSTPTAAQGPMAGFEALLAAFFGEPGEQAAGGLFGEDKTADEDAALQPGMADGPSTPPLSAEGQVLAAMLAGAPAQTVQAAPDAAETAVSERKMSAMPRP